MTKDKAEAPATAESDLDAENFLADIVGLLVKNLKETVGLANSASFVAAVGGRLSKEISREYGIADDPEQSRAKAAEAIAAICVDLKARIGGEFSVERIEDDRIIFRKPARSASHPFA